METGESDRPLPSPPLSSSDETRIISNILTPLPYILLYWIRLELFETLEFFIFVDIFNLCVVSSIKRLLRFGVSRYRNKERRCTTTRHRNPENRYWTIM